MELNAAGSGGTQAAVALGRLPGPAADLRHVVDAGLAPDLFLKQRHEIVRQAQEASLHGLGCGRGGPGFGLPELVLEFVEHLLDVPAALVEQGDDAGPDLAPEIGQIGVVAPAFLFMDDDAPQLAAAGVDGVFIGAYAPVERIGGVDGMGGLHPQGEVVLLAAEEVDAAAPSPFVPLRAAVAGLVPDVEDFFALARALAQGGEVLALEGAHVVLLAAGGLVADTEVVSGMVAEVERVKVADGETGSVGLARVVGGGLNEVAVVGADVDAVQFGEGGEGIGQDGIRALAQGVGHIAEEAGAAPAFGGLEESGDEQVDVLAVGELLAEVAPAVAQGDGAHDADLEPEVVGEPGAVAVVGGKLGRALGAGRRNDRGSRIYNQLRES